jgi:hypothetical protein
VTNLLISFFIQGNDIVENDVFAELSQYASGQTPVFGGFNGGIGKRMFRPFMPWQGRNNFVVSYCILRSQYMTNSNKKIFFFKQHCGALLITNAKQPQELRKKSKFYVGCLLF